MRDLTSQIFNEMDRFFDGWQRLSPGTQVYDERSFHPACDILESDDYYFMSIDLPGMRKEDIKIDVVDRMLTVSGERKRSSDTGTSEKVQRYEKAYGFFKRSFTLPSAIELNQVEARYENGVLELYLPKPQSAKPRQIEVQSGKSGIFAKLLGEKAN